MVGYPVVGKRYGVDCLVIAHLTGKGFTIVALRVETEMHFVDKIVGEFTRT